LTVVGKLLLDRGADINAVRNNGGMQLQLACEQDNVEVEVGFLLENAACFHSNYNLAEIPNCKVTIIDCTKI
jgi:hypothetical protein